jgi:hypothetical protein
MFLIFVTAQGGHCSYRMPNEDIRSDEGRLVSSRMIRKAYRSKSGQVRSLLSRLCTTIRVENIAMFELPATRSFHHSRCSER